MGSIMDKWFGFDPPQMPKLPPVAPIPIPEMDEGMDAFKRLRKRKGRSKTIVTGDLEPMDIGKRTLLG